MKKFNKVSEIMDSANNVDDDFGDILMLSRGCKFSDCTHTNERDCAVRSAISEGVLSEERFRHYYRIKKEAEHVSGQKNKTKAIDYMKQRKLFREL